ncbi:MAG: hypothetical protein LBD76_00550 [Prevotellaceae bacterium]|jgi:hypothetical protein|nr:hypothetical protein [Prevotellaceae bacterium]
MEKKVFRSRISVVIMGIVLATFILIAVPLFRYGIYAAAIIICGLWLLWLLNMVTGFRYEIVGDKLYLKLWAMTFLCVDITDIVAIERAHIRLYSPVASLKLWRYGAIASIKKLRLHFKPNQVCPYCFVSPVREQEFLEALKSVNPDIDIQITEKQGKWRVWDWDI